MLIIKDKTGNDYFFGHFKPFGKSTGYSWNSFLSKMLKEIDFGAFWVPFGKRKMSENDHKNSNALSFGGVIEGLLCMIIS